MKYEIYSDLVIARDFHVFEFVSTGKFGHIPKRIAFIPTELPEVYNLAFGDINENGEIDDYAISDNGDRSKIPATLAKVIELYTDRFPKRWIYFRGSTNERTRLYRMAISLNLEELSEKFEIYAEAKEIPEFLPFRKNMQIMAFLVKQKN